MNLKKITILLYLYVMVGGCTTKDGEAMDREKYGIPVQEYTGVEYPALEKEAQWEYIEKHRQGIEAAAINWFEHNYGFDVKVNHVYPKNGGLIAIVEWLNDPNLKMPIVMGYNEDRKEISGLQLTAMQLDNTIMSYIVYKIHEMEFNKLDDFLIDFCNENNLYGLADEYITNKGVFAGYRENCFYFGSSSIGYENTLNKFIENPHISIQELKNSFGADVAMIEKGLNEEVVDTNIMISLYFSNDQIDENIFKKLEDSLLRLEDIPDFNYLLILNENIIDSRNNMSINITYPESPTDTEYLRVNKEP